MHKSFFILAIETSCDDTSIALVKCGGSLKTPKFQAVANLVSSQIAVHRPFGGVVPNLAKREHLKNLPIILKKISKSYKLKTISYVAVTVGPGLEPALWTGVNFAKELARKLKKPLIGVNHMEGHIYSNWLSVQKNKKSVSLKKSTHYALRTTRPIRFPAIALIVSGGHTILLKMSGIAKWEKLGETLDDATGEAFDKVAKMLGLPYPGGPEIQKIALRGNAEAVKFPRPMLNQKNYNFSFSGLKTSVLYYLRDHKDSFDKQNFKADVAASFQQAVVDVLTGKTFRAAREFGVKSVMLSGGVSANKPLRDAMEEKAKELGIDFFAPEFEFIADNAGMIAAAAYIGILSKKKKLPIEAQSELTV